MTLDDSKTRIFTENGEKILNNLEGFKADLDYAEKGLMLFVSKRRWLIRLVLGQTTKNADQYLKDIETAREILSRRGEEISNLNIAYEKSKQSSADTQDEQKLLTERSKIAQELSSLTFCPIGFGTILCEKFYIYH